MTKDLISAWKRDNRKDAIAAYLDEHGMTEQADEVRAASRVTSALIDRVCITEAVEADVEESMVAEVDETPTTLVEGIETIIGIGSYKDAKKILKELGKDHSEYKRLKKLVKGMK